MDLGRSADAELLQRALDGEAVGDPGILELVTVLHAVTAVEQAGLAPRPAFVADLRARLLEEGASPAVATGPEAGSDAGSVTGPEDGSPATVSVLHVATRPLKLIAAAAAAIIVVGGALGVASRSAVPGDSLYGVKQLLNRAAVEIAGSRVDRGLTYLAQAQEHIDEARGLLDRGVPAPHDLDDAYDSATDATLRAQTLLLEAYRTEQRTDALTELSDFYARAVPQVDAMRSRVPAASREAWQRLRDTLGAGRVATLRELAACTACGDLSAAARRDLAALTTGAATSAVAAGGATGATAPATRPTSPRAAPTAGATAAPTRPGGTRPPGGPTGTATGAPTGTGPAGSGTPGEVAGGVTGGVTLPGATVGLPGVGVTSSTVGAGGGGVTLPGATVSLPTVGVTPSTIHAGGGGVTLPGVTVSVPSLTLPVPPLPLP
ncbi:hypothetical protein GCM10023258_30000 [Terrabacter aeriphilus]|uniref:DUF5667 domain-containing protein n=1 Tax=Terrabacter aeriphilus TaxID=515662 RepID=A0ABP9JGT5_9MICO